VLAVDLPDAFTVRRSDDPDLTCISLVIEEEMLQRALEAHPVRPDDSVPPAATLQAGLDLVCAFRRRLAADEHPAGKAISRLIAEEIILRVLVTPAGPMLKRLYNPSSVENRIRRSVGWMQKHYRESFDVSMLAADAGMSEATYYRHFKSLINVSPRQYIKHLRLTHARRLMIDEKLDASRAAFEVGYESPAHFNREFKRLFGDSPKRHVQQEAAAEA
jgi:transcriptional regulator GlxA family with amidase domain